MVTEFASTPIVLLDLGDVEVFATELVETVCLVLETIVVMAIAPNHCIFDVVL